MKKHLDNSGVLNTKWGISDVIIVLVLSFLVTMILQIVLTYVVAAPYIHSANDLIYENFLKMSTKYWYIVGLIMVLDSLFHIFFPIFWTKIKKFGGISILGLIYKAWAKHFLCGAAYGFGFAGIFVIPFLLSRFNIPYQNMFEPTKFDIYVYWFLFIKTTILAPIGDEILFTGFVFPAFAKKFGYVFGAIIVAVIFALSHFQYKYQIFPILILIAIKIITIWLYVKRNTLIASIGFHMTYNILAFIGEYPWW